MKISQIKARTSKRSLAGVGTFPRQDRTSKGMQKAQERADGGVCRGYSVRGASSKPMRMKGGACVKKRDIGGGIGSDRISGGDIPAPPAPTRKDPTVAGYMKKREFSENLKGGAHKTLQVIHDISSAVSAGKGRPIRMLGHDAGSREAKSDADAAWGRAKTFGDAAKRWDRLDLPNQSPDDRKKGGRVK